MDLEATPPPNTLPGAAPAESVLGKSSYICPMHPEVRQDQPGDCPKCGMPLERATVKAGAEEEANVQLEDMERRLSIGAATHGPGPLQAGLGGKQHGTVDSGSHDDPCGLVGRLAVLAQGRSFHRDLEPEHVHPDHSWCRSRLHLQLSGDGIPWTVPGFAAAWRDDSHLL